MFIWILKIDLKGLGGFLSARGLHALERVYAMATITPEYLWEDTKRISTRLGASACKTIGKINRTPNVMLIENSTETSDKIYDDVLR